MFIVPYLEMAFPRNGKWDDPIYPVRHLKEITGSRIYGTHHNANSLPDQLVKTAKVSFAHEKQFYTLGIYPIMRFRNDVLTIFSWVTGSG